MKVDYNILSLGEGTELQLCTDGSYTLRHIDASRSNADVSMLSIIQCYSNGYVNKVSVEDLLTLRTDYKYSHGIYPLANLLAVKIVSTADSISVKYIRNGTERSTSINVQNLRSHSLLGLKGVDIVGVASAQVIGWYLNENLISHQSESTETIKEKDLTSQNTITDPSNSFAELTQIANTGNALEGIFGEYLKNGRNIPIGQEYAKEVLSKCQTKEDFWYVIETLLKCHTHIYRSPIVDYLNEFYVPHFMPSIETLSSVCELLFSITAKPEKNLEFLHHFKHILTEEIKTKLINSIKSFSQPELYHKYLDILGYNINERIEYCIEQDNAAAYYCVYEMLLKVQKKEGAFAVSKLVANYIDGIDDTSFEGKLVKCLIYFDIKKLKKGLNLEVTKIKSGGYTEYYRLCSSHKEKKKTQSIQNSIATLVGKSVIGRYVATYSNHYFLMTSNGIRVLLPKNMSEKVLQDGSIANVQVVFADLAYKTLYATQKKPIDYKKIMQMPLLNNGDVIEVTFDLYGALVPHKCYKKIKIELDYYPKEVDPKNRYKAKVIRQTTDKYHYIVKII